MGGSPGEYTAGTPKDVKGLRKQLIDMMGAGLKTGATPYNGPLGANYDSGQLAGMNMLMGMSGNGAYKTPSFYSMGGLGIGQGGSNGTTSSAPPGSTASVNKGTTQADINKALDRGTYLRPYNGSPITGPEYTGPSIEEITAGQGQQSTGGGNIPYGANPGYTPVGRAIPGSTGSTNNQKFANDKVAQFLSMWMNRNRGM
jgi:hypothetical protein